MNVDTNTIAIPDHARHAFFDFVGKREDGSDKRERLAQTARRAAVALVDMDDPLRFRSVIRRPVWIGGQPLYQSNGREYTVGRAKTPPKSAILIEGTDLWVFRIH